MQRSATAWEDPAEEVVVTFYIGVNPRFDEFVAPTLHFSWSLVNQTVTYLFTFARFNERRFNGPELWPVATAAAALYVKKAVRETAPPPDSRC
jgi:hypothetical protein